MACFCLMGAYAAYLRDVPMTLTQPDGTVLHCYASGDEYFNYFHDENGFTIMQHPQTGFYVYADKQNDRLVATDYVAGRVDPASKNLKPFNLISPQEWIERRNAWQENERKDVNRDVIPNHGTLNNISIFIRFSDDSEFTNSYSAIDNMFNDVSEGAVSMRSYFRAASYGAIEIPTTFYPGHNGDVIISYQDTYPRSYFEPYNSSTNPNGYQDDERTEREFSLLQRAVNYINANYPIPTSLNIDYDNDGYVDNVCFIVRGTTGAWSSLLWPHKWSLYGKNVYINGKRVWTFNFQLADATGYFNTSTMCHEMNHSLGAPDLYHYYNGTNLSPAGNWDLMENNATPPQHCGAYMKMKYGHWLDEIPEITQAGTYTLNPISSATPTNIAYKIQSDDPNQYYVLEYRNSTSLFETALPGSGLLVYRIDTRFEGNADYDPSNGIYDEVYIFRPGGSTSANGNLYSAHFSSNVGRTEFSSSTSAYPFFTDGTLDYNFRIYDITAAGNTISFKYGTSSNCEAPTNLIASVDGNNVSLSWNAATNAVSYNIYRNGTLIGNTSGTTYLDSNVAYGNYTYFLKSIDANGLFSAASETITVSVMPAGAILIGEGTTTDDVLPSYSYYKYALTQQIYTSAELGGAGIITSIAFYNGGAEKTRTYDFYLKSTTKSAFSGTTDWVTVSNADKVFSGSVTMVADDWTTIVLDTPYNYDGISNLILVADDNSGDWTNSPHMSCRVFDATSQAIRIYSDNTNYDPLAPTSYTGTIMDVKNQLMLTKGSTNVFDITASANPAAGGTVSGTGQYYGDAECTLTATANEGYTFVNWTKNGTVVSTNASYTFTVTENAAYVANFSLNSYAIAATANPTVGGTISGSGTYNHSATATLTAIPAEGYTFVNWTVNGTQVSTNASYSFTVTGAVTLVANFSLSTYEVMAAPNIADGGIVAFGGDFNDNLFYDFEDGTSQGWTIFQGSNGDSPNTWMHCVNYTTNDLSSGYGHNGSNGFMLSESLVDNSTPVHPDNYLVSPQVLLGGSINFWATNLANEYGAEHFEVAVSTEGNTNAADFTSVEEWTLSANRTGGTRTLDDGVWYEYTVDLGAYSGMGYVAIHHFDCYDQWLLAVDDITIVEGYTGSVVGTFTYGESCTVVATANESYTFVNWTENGSEVSTDATYSFTVTGAVTLVADFSLSTYEVMATPNIADGGIVAFGGDFNDHLFYDFEDGTTQGWTIFQGSNGDSPDTWTHCVNYTTNDLSSGYGHSGSNGFMLSESLVNNSTPVHPDNYLVSPQVLLGGSINFWATNLANEYGAEHFEVAVSTEGNTNAADFTSVEEWTLSANRTGGTRTLDDGVWYEYTVDLGAYSGMGYVAIHHFDCYEQWLLAIDDITIVEGYTGYVVGTFTHGESCTVVATANEGYAFTGWTENGEEVSTESTYSFEVTNGRNLVANFEEQAVEEEQTVTLAQGMNWWSTYLDITLAELEEAIADALGANGTATIKSASGDFITYTNGGWRPNSLPFDIREMLKIQVSADCAITLTGFEVDPAEYPVTIHYGNNWIGCLTGESISVTEAFAGLNPAVGDVIKSKTGSAIYYSTGWRGELQTLEPGMGYMYQSKATEDKTFTFPTSAK